MLTLCGILSANHSCTNKEINLIADNPVKITTDYSSNAFVNELVQTSLILTPKNGSYPMEYFLKYEQVSGNGIYKLNDSDFTTDDVYTFNNATEIPIEVYYVGANEGKHRTKWILKNNFDQEFTTLVGIIN